jgi:hypothetical protein
MAQATLAPPTQIIHPLGHREVEGTEPQNPRPGPSSAQLRPPTSRPHPSPCPARPAAAPAPTCAGAGSARDGSRSPGRRGGGAAGRRGGGAAGGVSGRLRLLGGDRLSTRRQPELPPPGAGPGPVRARPRLCFGPWACGSRGWGPGQRRPGCPDSRADTRWPGLATLAPGPGGGE